MKPSRLSLRNRLLLTVLLPVALLLAALVGASIVRGERMTERAIAERGLAIVSFLAPAAEYGVISGSSDIIDNVLGALRSQGDVAAAVLYDRDGGLLAQRGEPRILDVAQVRLAAGFGRLGPRRQPGDEEHRPEHDGDHGRCEHPSFPPSGSRYPPTRQDQPGS